jgi:hypothetical protein
MRLKEIKKLVEDSPSSIFSKDDVLDMLRKTETEKPDYDVILETIDDVLDSIDIIDYTDLESADFYIDGEKKITLDYLEFKKKDLVDVLTESIKEKINEIEGDKSEDSEEDSCGDNCACKQKKKNKKKKL